MRRLHHNQLRFIITSSVKKVICDAEAVTRELIGNAEVGEDIVRVATANVVNYFRVTLGREEVSVNEFSLALEHVLTQFGLISKNPKKASFEKSSLN